MSLQNCENDFDCPGNLACYSPQDASWTNVNTSFCDCMFDEGWSRSDPSEIFCTVWELQAYYLISVDVITILTAIVLNVYALYYGCFRMARKPVFSEQKLTLLYCVLAALSAQIWRTVHIYSALNPNLATDDPIGGIKKPLGHIAQQVLIFCFAMFSMFAYLTVSLVWMQLIERLKILATAYDQLFMCFAKLPSAFSYKKAVYGVQLLTIAISIVPAVTANSIIASIVVVFPILLAFIMYIRGWFILHRILREAEASPVRKYDNSLDFEGLKRSINTTSIIVIFSLAGVLVGLAVFGSLYSVNNNTVPGSLSVAFIGRDIAVFSAFVGLIAIVRYLAFLTGLHRKKESQSPTASSPVGVSQLEVSI